jgi:hypothetical protein
MSKGLRSVLGAAVLMAGVSAIASESQATPPPEIPPPGAVVYVTSQGLYYDSIVLTGLPPKGPFQLLTFNEMEGRLETEFGPGDPGYLGGRWALDVNGSGQPDEGDMFFSCPLLAPGYEME